MYRKKIYFVLLFIITLIFVNVGSVRGIHDSFVCLDNDVKSCSYWDGISSIADEDESEGITGSTHKCAHYSSTVVNVYYTDINGELKSSGYSPSLAVCNKGAYLCCVVRGLGRQTAWV